MPKWWRKKVQIPGAMRSAQALRTGSTSALAELGLAPFDFALRLHCVAPFGFAPLRPSASLRCALRLRSAALRPCSGHAQAMLRPCSL
ncbi:MAG: hypothetical protein LC662_06420 [Rhodothermaceae bacterium]|nr:hypothetical protein [Rhodothermaceae bacterium]